MRRFLARFYTELRRRKVIQTAVLYAVSAWVLPQVAELHAITNPVMRNLHADPRCAAFMARLRLD